LISPVFDPQNKKTRRMGGCVFKVLQQRKQAHTQWVSVFFTFLLSLALSNALISTTLCASLRFNHVLYRLRR